MQDCVRCGRAGVPRPSAHVGIFASLSFALSVGLVLPQGPTKCAFHLSLFYVTNALSFLEPWLENPLLCPSQRCPVPGTKVIPGFCQEENWAVPCGSAMWGICPLSFAGCGTRPPASCRLGSVSDRDVEVWLPCTLLGALGGLQLPPQSSVHGPGLLGPSASCCTLRPHRLGDSACLHQPLPRHCAGPSLFSLVSGTFQLTVSVSGGSGAGDSNDSRSIDGVRTVDSVAKDLTSHIELDPSSIPTWGPLSTVRWDP